ncbi:chemotaxis protein CheB [Cohnella luojiensis]|uniref:protein-glutamate methylesterase n=2 Tax=Cohnella luojiensis TaxID=652876 RepID=A0A4Y8LU61_9BACL|nr:chemotaxis protein CheB [Cohnella luojiensis]
MSSGSLRMLPAVEEKAEVVVPSPPPTPSEKPEPIRRAEATLRKLSTDGTRPPSESERAKKNPEGIQRAPDGLMDKRIPRTGSSSQPVSNNGLPKVNAIEPKLGKEIVQRQELKPSPAVANHETSTKKTPKATVNMEKPAQAIPPAASAVAPKVTTNFTHLVAIGTSTGGPRALHEVLTGIPSDFPAPILVVQHMPPKFTHSLAQRLDNFCSIHVREAVDGEAVETATAYIAPGGKHMSLAKDATGKYRIRLSEEGPRAGHMPSVDVLFESLIGHQQLKRHAVLMTGMGSDGAKGMKALQTDGASTTIAEAEQTCVVYGMPRSAVELGAVSHQLPLQAIAPVLIQEVKTRKS